MITMREFAERAHEGTKSAAVSGDDGPGLRGSRIVLAAAFGPPCRPGDRRPGVGLDLCDAGDGGCGGVAGGWSGCGPVDAHAAIPGTGPCPGHGVAGGPGFGVGQLGGRTVWVVPGVLGPDGA